MKIAINGAGVAGPTLAWWLRESGHEPVLFERAAAPRAGGYVLDFWGYGYDVAEKMGILPELRARSYRAETLQSRDAQGNETSHISVNVFRDLTEGRYFSIARADLAEVIWSACDGIETRFSTHVTGVAQDASGVDVTLNTGETDRFDMLIGADGLHSAVRRAVFGPDKAYVRNTSLNVAAIFLKAYPHTDGLNLVSYAEPHREVNRFTLRDDRTMFLFTFDDSLIDAFPEGATAVKDTLRIALTGMRWEVPDILARLDEAEEIYFDKVAQVRMDSWHRGRVALVGDAAACPSLLAGEGSSLAMLEAWLLAKTLRENGDDLATAFTAWEAALVPLVHKKQDAALKLMGFFAPKSRTGIWLRDKAINLAQTPILARYLLGATVRQDFQLEDF